MTLDIIRPGFGRHWPDDKLVRIGRWTGAAALLAGAALAPIVMQWESLYRYAQDIWAPMAAPVTVVFIVGALWKFADRRGAVACILFAIATVPFTIVKSILGDYGIRFLPANLENPMVMAGTVSLISWVVMGVLRESWPMGKSLSVLAPLTAAILWIAIVSPTAMAFSVLIVFLLSIGVPLLMRSKAAGGMWDRSMLWTSVKVPWYAGLGLWWLVFAATLFGLYIYFW